jgi:hypothetical protein
MEFISALERAGFRPRSGREARGSRTFEASPNQYLTYSVHVYGDGSALFTWELAVTDYLLEWGIQLGTSESLNLFMFPVADERGPQDAAWLASVLERTESVLSRIDFLRATIPGG